MAATTPPGVFRSTDSGKTWTQILSASNINVVTIDPSVPGRVFVTRLAADGCLMRTLDGGDTWQPLITGLNELMAGRTGGVLIDPTNPQILYVGTEGGGVLKSRDGGEHWSPVNSGLEDLIIVSLTMDPADPSIVYALSEGKGVYKTVTGGEEQP